jgi:diaminopimelate epimerase
MRFSKYHGTGNDFVMIEDVDDRIHLDRTSIAALCNRRKGVGADGFIRIAPAPEADFFMDYYNAEGEPAEMCGNGIRCLAKYVYDRGLTSETEINVLTRAGLKHLVLEASDGAVRTVTVDMGPPAFERKAIPMTGEPTDTFIEQQLHVDGRTFVATALSMGNPHVVLFVDPTEDLATVPVATEHRGTTGVPEPDQRRVHPAWDRADQNAGVGARGGGDHGVRDGRLRVPRGE